MSKRCWDFAKKKTPSNDSVNTSLYQGFWWFLVIRVKAQIPIFHYCPKPCMTLSSLLHRLSDRWAVGKAVRPQLFLAGFQICGGYVDLPSSLAKWCLFPVFYQSLIHCHWMCLRFFRMEYNISNMVGLLLTQSQDTYFVSQAVTSNQTFHNRPKRNQHTYIQIIFWKGNWAQTLPVWYEWVRLPWSHKIVSWNFIENHISHRFEMELKDHQPLISVKWFLCGDGKMLGKFWILWRG